MIGLGELLREWPVWHKYMQRQWLDTRVWTQEIAVKHPLYVFSSVLKNFTAKLRVLTFQVHMNKSLFLVYWSNINVVLIYSYHLLFTIQMKFFFIIMCCLLFWTVKTFIVKDVKFPIFQNVLWPTGKVMPALNALTPIERIELASRIPLFCDHFLYWNIHWILICSGMKLNQYFHVCAVHFSIGSCFEASLFCELLILRFNVLNVSK